METDLNASPRLSFSPHLRTVLCSFHAYYYVCCSSSLLGNRIGPGLDAPFNYPYCPCLALHACLLDNQYLGPRMDASARIKKKGYGYRINQRTDPFFLSLAVCSLIFFFMLLHLFFYSSIANGVIVDVRVPVLHAHTHRNWSYSVIVVFYCKGLPPIPCPALSVSKREIE